MGKITVKHYINKKLNPIEKVYTIKDNDLDVEKIILTYPLYILVSYQGKNTRFRSFFLNKNYQDFEEINNNDYYINFLNEEERIIINIVKYEIDKYGNKFNLTGFGKRFSIYMEPIHFALDYYLKNKLQRIIFANEQMQEFSLVFDFYNPKVHFDSILKILKKYFENFYELIPIDYAKSIIARNTFFEFHPEHSDSLKEGHVFHSHYPKIFDWLNSNYKDTFLKYLLTNNIMEAESIHESIDKIINNQRLILEKYYL
jgi:hypothetical protein